MSQHRMLLTYKGGSATKSQPSTPEGSVSVDDV
jgi:hypothetical protein